MGAENTQQLPFGPLTRLHLAAAAVRTLGAAAGSFMVILDVVNGRTGEFFMSARKLAEVSKTCQRTAASHLAQLRREGFIELVNRGAGSRSHTYRIPLAIRDRLLAVQESMWKSTKGGAGNDAENCMIGISSNDADSCDAAAENFHSSMQKTAHHKSDYPVIGKDNTLYLGSGEIAAVSSNTPIPTQMAEIWNEIMSGTDVPAVSRMEPSLKRWRRAKKLLDQECGGDLGVWSDLCRRVRGADFLMGRGVRQGRGGPFIVSFDWVINLDNFVKVVEGNFETHKSTRIGGYI